MRSHPCSRGVRFPFPVRLAADSEEALVAFEYQALLVLYAFVIPTCALILWWDRRDRRRRQTTNSADSADEMAVPTVYSQEASGGATDRLSTARENGQAPDAVRLAARHAMEARGVTEISRVTGLPREEIQSVLTPEGRPHHDTVVAVAHAVGLQLHVEPRHPDAS